MPDQLSGNTIPSVVFEEHLHPARAKRVVMYGFDGANFNSINVDSSGAALVRFTGSLNFTGTINSTATVNIATSVTLFAVTSAGSPQVTVAVQNPFFTAWISNPQVTVSLAAGATVGVGTHNVTAAIASSVTLFVVGSPTLFAQVNVPAAQVTVSIASGATIGIGNSTVTAFLPSLRLDHAPTALSTAFGFGVGGVLNDGITGTPLNELDFGFARVNANRAWAMVIEDRSNKARYATVDANNALAVGIAATVTITPSATVTVSIAATVTTTIAPSTLLADGAANPTVPAFGAYLLQSKFVDGTLTFDRFPHSFYQNRTGVGTGSGAGTSVDMTTGPCSKFGMEIENATGTTSAWNINLEGSMDGTTWFTLVNQTSATGTAQLTFTGDKPVRFMRSNVTSVTGGGNVRVRIIAMSH